MDIRSRTKKALGALLALGMGFTTLAGQAAPSFEQPRQPAPTREQLQQIKNSGSGLVQDQGMTSPTHQKYVNKIVFTRQDVGLAQVDEGQFTNRFNLGEMIYYRVFMHKSSVNALRSMPGGEKLEPGVRPFYLLTFWLDGQKAQEVPLSFTQKPDEYAKWTTWRGAFKMEDSLRQRNDLFLPGEKQFQEFLAAKERALTPGNHTLKLELRPTYRETGLELVGDVIAAGEMTLNVPPNWTNPADSWLCLPQAVRRDAGLEKQMMADFSAKHPGETPLKINLTLSDWAIERHPSTGVLLRRTTSAVIGSKKGDVCRMQIYDFSQEHLGAAFSHQTYLSFRGPVQRQVPCGCLK